jgi:alkylated DNA repair dioxygenase AlkB
MMSLFPNEPAFPEGFTYVPDFLTEDDEKRLLSAIAKIELQTFVFQGFEAKRKFTSFGFDYSFDQRKLNRGRTIPDDFNDLIKKVTSRVGIPDSSIAELLVLEYPPGAVINWHRDAPPFDIIAGVSLLTDCTFRLRPHEKSKQGRNAVISFPVAKRSLYVMRGSARSEWQHSTAPVPDKRYSITLRTLK